MDKFEREKFDIIYSLMRDIKKHNLEIDEQNARITEYKDYIPCKTCDDATYFKKSNNLFHFDNRPQPQLDNLIEKENTIFKATEKTIKEKDKMPPKYSDGSFRELSNGTLEYRFQHEGKTISRCGQSKQECFNKRTAVISNLNNNNKNKKILTVGEWFTSWAEKYKKNKLTDGSYSALLIYINKHIIPKIGNIRLDKLTTDHLQEFINSIGRNNTKKKVISTLSDGLKKALATQKIKHNPFLAVEYKIEKSIPYRALQPLEQDTVYHYIKQPRILQLYFFCCCTGLRPGEALGVDIKDIDFEHKTIKIQQQRNKKNEIINRVKTRSSERKIPFIDDLFEFVKVNKTQKQLFFDISRRQADDGFKKIFNELNFKNVTPHSLRHTFVSDCYMIGIPALQIQNWVGHEDISTTLNIYAEILKNQTSFAIEYLKKLAKELNIPLRGQ